MRNNKGFTLIELLAVVAILITLIAIITPKIFKQLKTAEKVTDQEQINSIINVSKIYMNQNSNLLPSENDIYIISLNDLKQSGLIKTNQILNPSTKEELKGCILVKYENNKYKYEYKEENPLCKIKIANKVNNVKYYDNEWIKSNAIYFDPVEVGKCTKEDYNNNENKFGVTGCMIWYAYSENEDGTVNMILDHNTTAKQTWNNVDKINNDFTNKYGPSMQYLYELYDKTKEWEKALNRTTKDNYSISNDNQNYTIDYTKHFTAKDDETIVNEPYKARLIKAEEIAFIVGSINWNTSPVRLFFDGSSNGRTAGTNNYSWLFTNTNSCENYGCLSNNSSTYGYSTISPYESDTTNIWYVGSSGDMNKQSTSSTSTGIRPVITVYKNQIF